MSQDPKPAPIAGSPPGTPEIPPEKLMAEYAMGLKAYNQLYSRYEKSFYTKAAYLLKNHPSSEEAIKSVLTELWVQIADAPSPSPHGAMAASSGGPTPSSPTAAWTSECGPR